LAAAGVKGIDRAAMAEHPLTQAAIGAVIKSLNSELAMHERVRRFTVLTRELSLEEGELTPTMKVRRRVIAERFHDRIEAMYLKTQRAGDYELED
jgi:long-chain acyl-CoA synthetase